MKSSTIGVQSNFTRNGLPRLLTLAFLLYFWGVGLAGLDRFPRVNGDEPWIAAPGYTFWEKGTFGTDLFAGFFGAEKHYYRPPPVFSILVGAGMHLFGMGLFQMRMIPLICITLTLALTYRLGATLFSPWHGALAIALLAGWHVARAEGNFFSGIPLADLARIARYDVAVPLFGFSALLVLVMSLRKPSGRKCFVVGVLAGLATLSHVYGGFWLAVLVLLIVLYFRRAAKGVGLTLLGFGLVLAPWLLFVASGWTDFLNQNRSFSERFNLFDPQFYLTNLISEGQRYQPFLDGMGQAWGAQLGLALLVVGLGWLVVQAIRRGHQPSQLLLLVLGSLFSLFALLISFKTFSYLATLWPLFALVIAAGWVSLWHFTARRGWKLILVLAFCVAIVEGGVRLRDMQAAAAQATSYRTFTNAIAARLPPNSRVMGLQHYWLGLAEVTSDYRSILVPIDWTNPTYVEKPITFGEAAQAIPPDYMLIDQPILDLLSQASNMASPLHDLGRQMQDYLRFRHARLIADLNDRTYGRLLIYQLDPVPAG